MPLGVVELKNFTLEHISVYYEWMQDRVIQRLTGTEEMSREDVKGLLERSQTGECLVRIILVDGIPIGDIDLFPLPLNSDDSREDGGEEKEESEWEINMMIAVKEYRGRGYGRNALCMFLKECVPEGARVWAKVLKDNVASLRLFESAGFKMCKENGFGEIEMALDINKNNHC